MKSSRRIKFGPNFTDPQSQTLNFTIPDSRRRPQLKGILKKNDKDTESEPPVTTASKNLIMEHVKILKRGEVLNESSRILKEGFLDQGFSFSTFITHKMSTKPNYLILKLYKANYKVKTKITIVTNHTL
ncbi:hypothetical protein L2E82_05980 [Cichorium intybus]|uniref:Uncharacterized protein n=1 Tax=Cichorium intybus TaxID=13427 RepID=A0ACB9HAA8_CICIN|nr:hypothetical protein L2E82_05980 [Cichorium intybus]